MNLIERAKGILVSPKTEWLAIENENESNQKVLVSYLLIIALIPAIFSFIGYGLIGYKGLGFRIAGIEWGIKQAVLQYVMMVAGCYVSALIINMLAETFGAAKNFDKAFQLVAYSYTAACVGGVFYFYHGVSVLAGIASIYSLYLLYVGLKPMMKVPDDKVTTYFIVSLLVTILVSVVLSLILTAILGLRLSY